MDLSVRANFLTFITGGFDARFFNALAGDEYTVTKRSAKKEKIKAEYQFYYLLPETMKMWFVMPYDYKEDADGASYTMERFHMTDIAINNFLVQYVCIAHIFIFRLFHRIYWFWKCRARLIICCTATCRQT